jgi:hypothetical protein
VRFPVAIPKLMQISARALGFVRLRAPGSVMRKLVLEAPRSVVATAIAIMLALALAACGGSGKPTANGIADCLKNKALVTVNAGRRRPSLTVEWPGDTAQIAIQVDAATAQRYVGQLKAIAQTAPGGLAERPVAVGAVLVVYDRAPVAAELSAINACVK